MKIRRKDLITVGMVDFERIEAYILSENISVVELAKRVGLPMPTVAGLFRRVHYWGETRVKAATWVKISRFLGKEGF